jgi:hypothetical protein
MLPALAMPDWTPPLLEVLVSKSPLTLTVF